MESNLQKDIFEALDNARENGFDFKTNGWPPEEIAEDLIEFDSIFEGANPSDLIPHIETWLASCK